ncbi:tmRNA-binding protein [Bradyrhizobium sp. USDA 4369]
MADKKEPKITVAAENRKARFNYAIEDTIEAGIALTGTEVKSIRSGKSTIAESYADSRDGEILADQCQYSRISAGQPLQS